MELRLVFEAGSRVPATLLVWIWIFWKRYCVLRLVKNMKGGQQTSPVMYCISGNSFGELATKRGRQMFNISEEICWELVSCLYR